MLVTLSGIVTDVKPSQLKKAYFPMFVTLSEIVIDVKPSQWANTCAGILVTLSPNVTVAPSPNVPEHTPVTLSKYSAAIAFQFISVKLVQS